MDLESAQQYVLRLTGRTSIDDALRWMVEGRAFQRSFRRRELMTALITLSDHHDQELAGLGLRALHRASRQHLRSELDTGTGLINIDSVPRPQYFRQALDEIVRHTVSGTLRDISAAAVAVAQETNVAVIDTLSAVAGLTHKELKVRAHPARLPGKPRGRWSNQQCVAAFSVIDAVIRGTSTDAHLVAMRPVELLLASDDTAEGWDLVERMRTEGVSYEMLLEQRFVGSAWGAHRNRTSQQVQAGVATTLCTMLEDRAIPYRLLDKTRASKTQLAELGRDAEGVTSGQVKVIVQAGRTTYAVAISVAKDGGTANKSGGRLLQLADKLRVPVAVILAGPGWAARGESVDLVRAFAGRVYTELTMTELVDDIVVSVTAA